MKLAEPWVLDSLLPELSTVRATPVPWPDAGVCLQAAAIEERGFDRSWFAAAGIACPERIYEAARRRQAEFFGGRLCAAAALAGQGCAPAAVGIGPLCAPLWPAGVVGSITHTRSVAVAVALPAREWCGIGLNLEEVDAGAASAGLETLVTNRSERERLGAIGGLDAPTLLVLVHAAKKSFFKGVASALTRHCGLEALEFLSVNPAAGRLNFVVREPLTPRFAPGTVWSVAFTRGGGHVLTLFAWRGRAQPPARR